MYVQELRYMQLGICVCIYVCMYIHTCAHTHIRESIIVFRAERDPSDAQTYIFQSSIGRMKRVN
jgi:hypothetical protein